MNFSKSFSAIRILSIIILLFIYPLSTLAQYYLAPSNDSLITILPQLVGFNNQMASSNEPWNDYNRKLALKRTEVGLLRYPGGTVSNYWDMENQRLFQNANVIDTTDTNPRKVLKTENVIGWVVPMWSAKNSIANLKNAYSVMQTSNDAEPAIIFVLNMLTPGADYYSKKWNRTINENPLSDDWWKMMDDRLSKNIKMLDDAVLKGIPVKYIEFGNEYYFGKSKAGEGANGGSIVEPYSAGAYNSSIVGAFPGNGKSYADAVNNWADTLIKRYPGVRLCAIGADANSVNPSRRNSWNKEVVPHIEKDLVPAISLHIYNGVNEGNLKTSEENLGKAFASWLDHWEWIKKYSLLPTDREFWYTEYNNNKDKKTWGHGLLNLFTIHTWLQEGNLGLTNYHQFAQNSITGSGIYASTRAFAMLARSTRGKTIANKLKVQNSQNLEGSGNKVPKLIAWSFKNETDEELNYFFINFSSEIIEIYTSNINGAVNSGYSFVESTLSRTSDPGVKNGIVSDILELPAYSCALFKAGRISPPTGMSEIIESKKLFSIFPNPGENKISIESLNGPFSESELTVFDMAGEKVFKSKNSIEMIQNELNNSIYTWNNGIYFFLFKDEERTETYKWIKNN
ncbi:MAG: T9SS type A sorting domain-containing protein [Draconibacterium sp.]|nr:T9SS type A sorting domain-containing protein [Draconibacterium sp.]